MLPDLREIAKLMLVYKNVRSLQSNMEFVRADRQLQAADVLVFSESHAHEGQRADLVLPSFQHAYYNDRHMRLPSFASPLSLPSLPYLFFLSHLCILLQSVYCYQPTRNTYVIRVWIGT